MFFTICISRSRDDVICIAIRAPYSYIRTSKQRECLLDDIMLQSNTKKKLTVAEKGAIVFLFVQGKSLREVAEIVGWSKPTVIIWLGRHAETENVLRKPNSWRRDRWYFTTDMSAMSFVMARITPLLLLRSYAVSIFTYGSFNRILNFFHYR